MAEIIITGRLGVGLGKGKYFMRQNGYKRQFVEKLRINPFHGTLNVELADGELRKLNMFRGKKGILIKGFARGKRTFGNVRAYKADISGIRCALVVPERTTHSNIAEIISSEMLRKKLGIAEGEKVTITVFV